MSPRDRQGQPSDIPFARRVRATRKLRGFNACIRATQATKSEAANFWCSLLAKQQKQYDNPTTRSSIVRRLRRVSDLVRDSLSVDGQSCLDRGSGALSVEGVVYAVVVRSKIYVGQTIHSSFERFRQHIWATAKTRFAGTPFHRKLFRCGLNDVVLFPLEKIPSEVYETGGRGRLERFRAVALARELYWIRRLTTQLPFGLNVVPKLRRRPRRKPLMWRRAGKKPIDTSTDPNGTISSAANSVLEPYAPADSFIPRKLANGKTDAKADTEAYPSTARTFGYRDFVRRCQYLAKCFEMGTLGTVDWATYRRANLWRMLRVLTHKLVWDISEKARKAIMADLRAALMIRPVTKKQRREGCTVIHIDWTAHVLRAVALKRILAESESMHILPAEARESMEHVLVARRLVSPIAPLIFNFAKVARELPELSASEKECPCRTLFSAQFRPHGGCVLTGDLSLVRNDELRALLQYGPRFRLTVRVDPMTALRDAIDNLITRLSETHGIVKGQFTLWREYILERCHQALMRKQKRGQTGPRRKLVELTAAMRKHLRFLHRLLVMVPTDKAANNVAFVCKALYVKELRNELSRRDGAYESWNENPDQIIQRHRNFLSHCHLAGQDKLPYLYWMPKLHKEGKRFIAGSPACSTREASKVLSDGLQLILRTMREKDDYNLRLTGIRRYFVVNGYEEVVAFIHNWPRVTALHRPAPMVARRLYTGDFSTLYTTIPHDDLTARLGRVCDEAWEWACSHRFHCSADEVQIEWTRWECQWVQTTAAECHTDRMHRFKRGGVKALLGFLISNTFLVNGGVVRRQRLGIPMGTNNAPAVANSYLFSYESEYVDRIARQNLQRARAFHMSFRFIDDVLSIDNACWLRAVRRPAEEGGLYPRALQLNATAVNVSEVQFLGMRIIDNEDVALQVEVFDKRKAFPFAVRRYPHMDSLIPVSIPYGVFTGQLYRYFRICSHWRAFVNTACELGKTLIHQGCSANRLRHYFLSFLRKRSSRRWRLSAFQLYRMFSEGLGNS